MKLWVAFVLVFAHPITLLQGPLWLYGVLTKYHWSSSDLTDMADANAEAIGMLALLLISKSLLVYFSKPFYRVIVIARRSAGLRRWCRWMNRHSKESLQPV